MSLLSEVPKIWIALDLQSRQHLGTASRGLRAQMRQNTTYLNVRMPMLLQPQTFAPQMMLFSTMQPTLRALVLSAYSMSAQDVDILTGCNWRMLQLLKLTLCTATTEDYCSGIATLAHGHWPSLQKLQIVHKAIPHIYSRSGEGAIRLFLRGRWPVQALFLSSNLWPTKDGCCGHSIEQMWLDAAPGDEYRNMLLQSALRYHIAST